MMKFDSWGVPGFIVIHYVRGVLWTIVADSLISGQIKRLQGETSNLLGLRISGWYEDTYADTV